MKIIAYSAASAIALVAATPVLAQDITIEQIGTNHSVSVIQIEDALNSITVTQAADSQIALVRQVGNAAANTAFVAQGDIGGTGSNDASIIQNGSDNIAAVGQNSTANLAALSQDGNANFASVDQGFTGGSGTAGDTNNTRISQFGNNGVVSVEQNFNTSGNGNDTDVLQFNDGNAAYIQQEDVLNVAFVVQGDVAGDGGHTATISQIGNSNLVAIGQNSSFNQAVANQSGDGNEMFIDQGFNNGVGIGSDNNYAEGNQTGIGNELTINQNVFDAGGGNSATINQSGNNNTGTINQSGDNHTATLTQTGNNFTYQIDQVGSGMVADITQN